MKTKNSKIILLFVLLLSLNLTGCGGVEADEDTSSSGSGSSSSGSSGSSSSGSGSSSSGSSGSSSSGSGSSSSGSSGSGSSSSGSSSSGSSGSGSSSSGSSSSSSSGSSGGVVNNELKIHSSNYVARLLVPSSIAMDEDMNSTKLKLITKKLYESFNDVYDYIFIVSNNTTKPDEVRYYGVHYNIQNTVKGIGSGLFNYGTSYGSAGKLKGIIHFPYRAGIKNGPALHEMAHGWANRIISSGGHWGYTGFVDKGQLGGYKASTLETVSGSLAGGGTFSADRFGTFANGGNGLAYNEVELYLMGFIKKPTSDIYLADNPSNASGAPSGKRYFKADKITKIGFDTYLSNQNIPDRDPPYTSAKKRFKVLTVLIDNAEVKDSDLTEVGDTIKWFSQSGDDGKPSSYTFAEATRFLGTLVAGQIDQDLKQ